MIQQLLLGIYLKKTKTRIWKEVSTPMFIAALLTVAKILPFMTTWMDLEGIILSEISQTEKDKLYDLTYMYNRI